jgi:hypothetical protein
MKRFGVVAALFLSACQFGPLDDAAYGDRKKKNVVKPDDVAKPADLLKAAEAAFRARVGLRADAPVNTVALGRACDADGKNCVARFMVGDAKRLGLMFVDAAGAARMERELDYARVIERARPDADEGDRSLPLAGVAAGPVEEFQGWAAYSSDGAAAKIREAGGARDCRGLFLGAGALPEALSREKNHADWHFLVVCGLGTGANQGLTGAWILDRGTDLEHRNFSRSIERLLNGEEVLSLVRE